MATRREVELAGAALMKRIGGVVRSAEELQAYLVTVVNAVKEQVGACDEAGITVLDVAAPPTTVSTTGSRSRQADVDAYGSLLAVSLASAGETLGSLDLYAARTDAFDGFDTAGGPDGCAALRRHDRRSPGDHRRPAARRAARAGHG